MTSRAPASPVHQRARAGSAQLLALFGCVLLAGLLAIPTWTADAADARPFRSGGPFNTPIAKAPRIDPASKAMVSRATRSGTIYSNLVAFGIPIYTARASTPRVQVSCQMEGAWGKCPLSRVPMPIPAHAEPNVGEDGVLTVIDPTTKTVGEYWQARRTASGWEASWGAVNSLSGTGWGGASTGAGASRLAGVIRVSEIRQRSIPHALVLQTDNVCVKNYRAPALKTDGLSKRSDCIPEGARVQLDPALNLSKIPGLSPAERTIARALQVYGGYVIDRGGAPMSVSFERAGDATGSSPGSVYAAAGLSWDYYGLSKVPWQRLRVLKTWNG